MKKEDMLTAEKMWTLIQPLFVSVKHLRSEEWWENYKQEFIRVCNEGGD